MTKQEGCSSQSVLMEKMEFPDSLVSVHPHCGAVMKSSMCHYFTADPLCRELHPQAKAHREWSLTNNRWVSERRTGPKPALAAMAPTDLKALHLLFFLELCLCHRGPSFLSRLAMCLDCSLTLIKSCDGQFINQVLILSVAFIKHLLCTRQVLGTAKTGHIRQAHAIVGEEDTNQISRYLIVSTYS